MTNSCQTNSMSDQLTCSSLAVKCLPVACSWRNLGWSLDKFDRLPTPMLFGNPPASTSLAVTPRTSQLRSLANHQNINLSESECAKSTRLWTDLLFLRETAGRCVNETPIDMLRIYVLKRELGHSNWSWEFVALYIHSICSNGNQTRLWRRKKRSCSRSALKTDGKAAAMAEKWLTSTKISGMSGSDGGFLDSGLACSLSRNSRSYCFLPSGLTGDHWPVNSVQ